jgi:DNA-binding MarR family transcriptional regulator
VPLRTQTVITDEEVYSTLISTFKLIKHVAVGYFSDEGITEPQLQTLELLMANGPTLMRKISDCMMVTPANVTGIVDRLEQKKLVQRTSGKGDRRATIIEITPAGKTLYETVGRKKVDMIQKSLETFTKDEKVTLKSLLEKFQKGISRSVVDFK